MCGIVGYVGENNSVDILMNGLYSLEYRGYDSAGISIVENDNIKTFKSEGKIENLQNILDKVKIEKSNIGIGHTRWATHGAPSDINAHPHSTARLSLVHNGIIENYKDIKNELIKKGYKFVSETDTEVAANLIDSLYDGNPLLAIKKAIEIIEGSYAFAIIFKDKLDKVYAIRKGAPLIVALGKDGKNENFIASDIPAILKYTNKYILMEEENIAELQKDKVAIYDKDLKELKPAINEANWTLEQAEKSGYEHFMIKEIHEQPKAILDTIEPRIVHGIPDFKRDNILDENFWTYFDRVYIVGCGTAMHAAMIGKRLIEDNCRIPVECEIASEFRYKNPILTDKTLAIFVSQSGETADTLAALNLVKEKGCKSLAIVNVNGSSIARASDYVIYTYAGPEISVASTKAYSVQVAIMYLITFKISLARKLKNENDIKILIRNMLNAIDSINKLLDMSEEIKKLCVDYKEVGSIFFMGRDLDYYQVMEGALKMKEISYIHCEAYAGGELKHGVISLITEGTSVVALAIQEKILNKMISNIKEVVSRGAKVLLFAKEGMNIDKDAYDKIIYLPNIEDMFMPIASIIALQLLAYHTAVVRGCDVDKPRNLAKSVTVE
ncbi:glutamine--fructose-6-phosphate transaminase (isomerizing) [Brachyspira sp.]|uniref:glutamine--fructose-6-phosphate transaminase (isomerizing) n=1 Tax=Brachyspira sp. TaxID=1977261 RepID=UPI003D7EC142